MSGHPRVGGEQRPPLTQPAVVCGSSPRGRGTGFSIADAKRAGRVIPAWAGNRTAKAPLWRGFSGHPRVGGEQATATFNSTAYVGSSPRGRGTAGTDTGLPGDKRVIPAWAGNRPRTGRIRRPGAGHPRVGGEQLQGGGVGIFGDGSSPRGRGTESEGGFVARPIRVIPAWAGNRRSSASCASPMPGHPRVGGEQFVLNACNRDICGSSPRGRGTVVNGIRASSPTRVIPAWAGNRTILDRSRASASGHPRVGGEQSAGIGA